MASNQGITRRAFSGRAVVAATGAAVAPLVVMRAAQGRAESGGTSFNPAYLALHETGELRRRGEVLHERMRSCDLCPRACGVDRLAGQEGICRADSRLIISSHGPHFGEEPPLVGRGGSGTVFFAHCSLRCVFCINYPVSHGGQGRERSIDDLAQMMLSLQERGCSNINVVTPTHYSPHILLALDRAAAGGLRLPLVYNTCAWEQEDVLQLLDGVVDIYLPDFKYADAEKARRHLGGARDFPGIVQRALLEMHRQVGTARKDPDGLIRRGLMIRHLVMPNDVADTRGVIEWIAANLPKDTYVNLMSQYTPVHRASEFPEINRRIRRAEYAQALQWADDAGLTRVDSQRMPWF